MISEKNNILKREIPKELENELTKILEQGEDIHIAVSSDMNPEGEFEDCWLLATNRRLFAFSSNHDKSPELICELLISDIRDFSIKNLVGNGILEIQTDNEAIEFLRFSKTALRENQIDKIPYVIDRLREMNGQEITK